MLELAEENAEAGHAPPAALLERPDLTGLPALAFDAFQDLTGDRSQGFGSIGRIPWTSIRQAASHFGIVGEDQFERFKRLVQVNDKAWMEKMRVEMDKGGK